MLIAIGRKGTRSGVPRAKSMRTEWNRDSTDVTSAAMKATSEIMASLNATLDLKASRFACERSAMACLR